MKRRSTFLYSFFLIFFATFFTISPVYALDSSILNIYSQNNILFYDPNSCKTTSDNGIFPGTKYNLSDEELKGLVRVAQGENSCCLTALKAELSIMANLYERNGSKYSSIPDYVLNGGWFASSTTSKYDDGSEVSSEYLEAARDIYNNGNRTIPLQIYEHDYLGDISSISNDNGTTWITSGLDDRSKYSQGTIIKNKYGSTYIFYQWAGGKESDCGDPFGYFEDDPPESTATPNSAPVGDNKDYEGNQVFTDDQWERVQEFKPLYEEAAKSAGIPWPMLAAVHVRESNLSRTNPNADGIFQILALDVPSGHENTDAEFLEQAKMAAEYLKTSMGDGTSDDAVKRAFFSYNGRASVYIAQARDLGFTEEQANNGEGSPYVMNRADKQRDPQYNKTTWGQIKRDHGPIEYPANMDYGAYVYYLAAGGGTGSGICSSGAGNMDLNQTAIDLAWPIGDPHNSSNGGAVNGTAMALLASDPYMTALTDVGLTTYGDHNVEIGASCDAFVTTVVRYSGVDPNFYCCGTSSQLDWLRGEGAAKWEEITYSDTNDTSFLKPGDILILSGHIKMYIEQDGEGREAQASYGDHSGQITNGVSLNDSIGRGKYYVFRAR